MKKIFKILCLFLLLFIGINETKAASQKYEKAYDAKCTNYGETAQTCTYRCVVNYEEDDESKEFIYKVAVEYNLSKNFNVLVYGIEKGSENTKSIFSANPEQHIIYNKNSYVISKDVYNTASNIKDNFVVNDTLKCRNIISTLTIVEKILDGNSGKIINKEYYFGVDPKSILDENIDITDHSVCGLLGGEQSKTVNFIKKIYGYIKVIIPLLIIILGITDFIKVIVSGKDDDMKKSINKFAKRIILAVVFILTPILISILINVSGLSSQYDGLSDGMKAIFCILE